MNMVDVQAAQIEELRRPPPTSVDEPVKVKPKDRPFINFFKETFR